MLLSPVNSMASSVELRKWQNKSTKAQRTCSQSRRAPHINHTPTPITRRSSLQPLKLAAAHDGEEVDSGVEKRLIKKIDWYLMPLVRYM
jgi:hypothetical protein